MKKSSLFYRFGKLCPLPLAFSLSLAVSMAGGDVTNPVVYVTQVPVTEVENTVVAISGSHLATTEAAPRGGGLMIHYPDNQVRNLTSEAGFGVAGLQQGSSAIAVRDPQVNFDGTKIVFSMVVGAPTSASDQTKFYWQVYEASGLSLGDTAIITKVDGQPDGFNNIQPTYGSNGDIFFVSDRTLDGTMTTYPARNEQGGESVTGIWKLARSTSKVSLVDHSPSGSFKPFVDSFGRVVFSRWDHLQRDEHAATQGGVDYSDETAVATKQPWSDVYPETMTASGVDTGHKFDLFLPWTVNQDGTGLLTMNHLGRHELGTNFKRSRIDSNLVDVNPNVGASAPVGSPTRAGSYLHLAECPETPGKYVATDAVSTAISSGRLVTFTAPPTKNSDDVVVEVVNNSGIVRDPTYLSDGRLMGSFVDGPTITGSYGGDRPAEISTTFIPDISNPFTIKVSTGTTRLDIGVPLSNSTSSVSVTNYFKGATRNFNGKLWQLQPVEIVSSPVPAESTEPLHDPETEMFKEAGVSVAAVKAWMAENKMALVVSRNVTSRDDQDKQQPYNLFVPGGAASLADGGPAYAVSAIQFFQGDYVRGYEAGGANNVKGRRVKPQAMHEAATANIDSGVLGSTQLGSDGSMAMFVPANRALTWQLTDDHGSSVVRERYWLNFSAGEIRLCSNCHAQNESDQLGRLEATNSPEALKTLLTDWSERHPEAEADVSPYEFWAEMEIEIGAAADGDADEDGLSNIEEYGYGGDPNVAHTSESAVRALRSELVDIAGEDHVVVSFTRNVEADQLRVVIEASSDLNEWSEAATLQGRDIGTDGSVRISTSADAEQEAAGVEVIKVRDISPVVDGRSRYFRLRFISE